MLTAFAQPADSEKDLAEAQEFLQSLDQVDDLLSGKPVDRFIYDYFSLLQQSVYQKFRTDDEGKLVPAFRAIPWWSAQVVMKDYESGETLETIDLRANRNFVWKKKAYTCPLENCRFSLRKYSDPSDIHEFFMPVRKIATYGPFILFFTNHGVDRHILSMIDLETFNSSFGNEPLPVFEIPVATESNSTTRDETLKILDDPEKLNPGWLQETSKAYHVSFNLMGAMVDPSTAKAISPLVDSFLIYIKRAREDVNGKAENASPSMVDFERLFTSEASRLKNFSGFNDLFPKASEAKDELQKVAKDPSLTSATSAAEALAFVEKLGPEIQTSQELKAAFVKVKAVIAKGRTALGKLNWLVAIVTNPRPGIAQKTKDALSALIAGAKKQWARFRKKEPKASPEDLKPNPERTSLALLASRPLVTASMAAAMLLAVTSPHTYTQFFHSAFDLGGQILGTLKSAWSGLFGGTVVGNLGDVVVANSKQTFSIYGDIIQGKPFESINNQYIANGAWQKTPLAIGAPIVAAGFLWLIFHLASNGYLLIQDRKKPDYPGFVERQARFEQRYMDELASSEILLRKRRNEAIQGQLSHFTFDDEIGVDGWIQAKIDQRLRPLRGKSVADFKDPENTIDASAIPMSMDPGGVESVQRSLDLKEAEMDAFANALKASPTTQEFSRLKPEEKTGLVRAIYRFLFSTATFASTIVRGVLSWNVWSGIRYCTIGWSYVRVCGIDVPVFPLTPKPLAAATRIYYPNFFRRLVLTDPKKTTIPTDLNGGTESLPGFLTEYFRYWLNQDVKGADRKAYREQMKSFEQQIIPIEGQVAELATRRALANLPQFLASFEDVQKLFTSDGAASIVAPLIRELHVTDRTFVRIYFEQVFNESMQRILEAKLKGKTRLDNRLGQPEWDLNGLKKAIVDYQLAPDSSEQISISMDEGEIRRIVNEVASDQRIFTNAANAARDFRSRLQAMGINLKHAVMSDLDPAQNKSMERYATVARKLKDPLSVNRAVRAELSNLSVTLWVDLAMNLVLMAGIDHGLGKPIQNALWGPNSIFYGSQYVFWGGFLSGWVMGFLGNAWVKLQEDEWHDASGNFGEIPTGRDAHRSYLSWLWKMTFSKQNSLWKNWQRNAYTNFWNMPAAFLNIELFKYIFLGRVEFDPWIALYLVAFFTPASAFRMMIEQGFERSTYYDARDLPDVKLLAHPRVQRVLLLLSQWRRNRFNLWHDVLYTQNIGSWFGNLPIISTPEHGPRSFMRVIFGPVTGGLTPDETIVHGARELAKNTQGVPFVGRLGNSVKEFCEFLLMRPDLVTK